MDGLIKGVSLNALKIIPAENGAVMHALKINDESFISFGEAYFSSVKKGSIKGWKCHSKMTLNIVVPVGCIRFVIYDDRRESTTYQKFNDFMLGPEIEYARLTISPNLWMAFQGIGENLNLLLNLANILHDPAESKNLPVINNHIPAYDW